MSKKHLKRIKIKEKNQFGLTYEEWMNLSSDEISKYTCEMMAHDCSCGEICEFCNKNLATGVRVVYKVKDPEETTDDGYPSTADREFAIAQIYIELAKNQPSVETKGGFNKKIRDDTGTIKAVCINCHNQRRINDDDQKIKPPFYVSYLMTNAHNHKVDK